MEKKRVFVKIKNFKSLVDIDEVELKPLTFLLGANSAGKSSFINALKFLGNYVSIFYNDINPGLNPYRSFSDSVFRIDSNSDLVSFNEIVTKNDIKKQIEFEIRINNSGSFGLQLVELDANDTTQQNFSNFNLQFDFCNAKQEGDLLKKVTVDDLDNNESHSYKTINEIHGNVKEAIKNIFVNPTHVHALRDLPEKSFPLSNGRFDLWSYYFLLRMFDEEYGVLDKTNEFFKKPFGFNEFIDVKKEILSGCLMVKNRNAKTEYNLATASSGLLQLLPIIGKLVQEDDSLQLFFCEQPELHLHPKLQTKLAEFFTDVKFKDRYKVIETHSEHIIRKIQVLIAQKSLNKEEVAVYYFDKKNGETKIKEMKLSERGLFVDDWPEGFFDEDTKLFSELFQAIHKN